ncbi:D-amino-acid dehydrogenase [Rhodoligotrophos appendicifer]|uniref:NAD(P)/FAD-dependent oxidoreductase n=1 Tax=Rhodoligotrophos appendicifer TaxID=987056 RepID=UPI001186401E|nr:FAD-dependent oxidoreductase [Rhodoligotrophos appendicifer]
MGQNVVVIGAGVVGMGCASYLQRDGHQVTVIDRVEPGRSTSFGNGGGIASTFVLPLAMPGLMKKYVKYYLDPEGPVSLRWSHMPQMLPFLWKFLRNCRPERVKECTEALTSFMPPAYAAWKPLFEEAGLTDLVRAGGGLWIYKDDAALRHDWPFWQGRRDKGLPFEVISDDELRQLEPSISRDYKAAVLETDWHYVRNPYKIVAGLAELVQRKGGKIVLDEVVDFDRGPEGVTAVLTKGGRYPCDAVVIAAGAWSDKLARKLGSKVPLESQRGYHVTLPNSGVDIRHLIIAGAAKIAITPMDMGLRIVGASAFPGIDAPADWRQSEMVLSWGKRILPGINAEGMTQWFGERPLTPDSLPVLGASPHFRNAFYAFGHSHMGLTTGAITGKLIAEAVSHKPTSIDLAPFRIDRSY